jgi:site-specific recombinase XerD
MTLIKPKFRPSAIPDKEGVVYFQIICDRKVKLITSPYMVLSREWNRRTGKIDLSGADAKRYAELLAMQTGIDNEIRKLRQAASYLQSNGENVLERINYRCQSQAPTGSVFLFIEHLIDNLRKQGRDKTAGTYVNARRSFSKFLSGNDIRFNQVDANLIKQYEMWLKNNGLRLNTVSFYMRIMRAVYNKAVEQGLTAQNNPFRQVYTGIEKTIKRAVDEDAIKCLSHLSLPQKGLAFARDMFMLGVYARGMAFVDLANLKKINLRDGYLTYCRHKTRQRLSVRVEPCIQRIIDRHPVEGEYLLPILTGTVGYSSALRLQNGRLQRISKMLGLSTPLSTYVARHSWASLAKRSGVSLQVISEGMGHDNEATTRIYLASLDRSVIDDANAMLLSKL